MTPTRLHLVLMRPGFEEPLKDEFSARFSLTGTVACRAGVSFSDAVKLPKVVDSVFARQILPRAMAFTGSDDSVVAGNICDRIDVMTKRGNRQRSTSAACSKICWPRRSGR